MQINFSNFLFFSFFADTGIIPQEVRAAVFHIPPPDLQLVPDQGRGLGKGHGHIPGQGHDQDPGLIQGQLENLAQEQDPVIDPGTVI